MSKCFRTPKNAPDCRILYIQSENSPTSDNPGPPQASPVLGTKHRFPLGSPAFSGAGTNMKVGAPVQSKSGGGTDPAQRAENFFLVVPLHFLALKAQLVVSVSTFVTVSTVWLVSLLFFYSRCPRAQSFLKVGGRAPVPHGVGATASVPIVPVLRNDHRGVQR